MRRLALLLLAAAACGHDGPFAYAPPTFSQPLSAALPRRLTYHPGDDRMPSVHGDVIVFARQSDAEPALTYAPAGRETCLAWLPLGGGTLLRALCPERFLGPTDTLVDTWFEPALSPDGRRVAFNWQRALRISALGYVTSHLMVTDADRPADTTAFRQMVRYVEAAQPGENPRRADIATRITWVDDGRLLFLATFEQIIKVKGGGASRVTDTLFVPLALMTADLATGSMTVVPGGDSVIAYAAAPGGGLWVVKAADSAALLRLEPSSGLTGPVGAFSGAVRDLIVVDGAPVAIVGDGAAIERLEPATGVRLRVGRFTGPVIRLAPAGGRRLVAEVEAGSAPFGSPPDLWLVELP